MFFMREQTSFLNKLFFIKQSLKTAEIWLQGRQDKNNKQVFALFIKHKLTSKDF